MVERRGSAARRLARLTEANARLRRRLVEQASLWRIAHQDPLTELWNRRYADERLAEEMLRAEDDAGYRFSLVLADVNDLKRINDERGHAAGDQALKWVARFLAGALRADDVCCRLGGDEFLLILPDAGAEECREFVKRLRAEWRHESRAHHHAVAVSLGTASYPTHGATVEALCAVADAAMYEEKRRSMGRGRLVPEAAGEEPANGAGAQRRALGRP
jgi:diguanylate cyclase (GGDEF)-like protein